DGVDDVTVFGNAVGNFGTSDFSVAFWVKTTGTSMDLVSKRLACAHGSFFDIRLGSTGVPNIELDQDGGGTNFNTFQAGPAVTDGLWHHLTLIRQGTTATLYVDGAFASSGSSGGVTNISNTAQF